MKINQKALISSAIIFAIIALNSCKKSKLNAITFTDSIFDNSNTIVLAAGSTGKYYKNGMPKSITITNSGLENALDISANISGTATSGLSVQNNCSQVLAPGESCTITFIPGQALQKTPFSISGSNTSVLKGFITVLDYGSFYQDGLVYALVPYVFGVSMDASGTCDYTGGNLNNCSKIASVKDISTAVAWDTNGVSAISTNAKDLYNGVLNTKTILNSSACSENNCHAVNACANYSTRNFTDWYFPAICEMGNFVGIGNAGCTTGIDNMNNSLVLNQMGNFSVNPYWSSTEPFLLANQAFAQVFDVYSFGGQFPDTKSKEYRVRCSRLITP